MRQAARPGDRVLYVDEVGLYPYLTEGCWDLGAICLPFVKGTPDEAQWIAQEMGVRFVVLPHPVREAGGVDMFDGRRTGIRIKGGQILKARWPAPVELSQWGVRMVAPDAEATVVISADTAGRRLDVTDRAERYLLAGENRTATEVSIIVDYGGAPVVVVGLTKNGADDGAAWAWNRGIQLVCVSEDGRDFPIALDLAAALARDSQVLAARGALVSVRALSDSGGEVLAEIELGPLQGK